MKKQLHEQLLIIQIDNNDMWCVNGYAVYLLMLNIV